MPGALGAPAACAVGKDIYVFGNGTAQPMYKYDTIADVWSILGLMPVVCGNHSASVVDRFLYIVGAGCGDEVL
jgi:hypothetical protein